MISIVIPLYNKEAFVGDAVQSILDQTFDTFELIVVNDGSTDRSVQVIEKLDNTRIEIISIEKSGVSIARNTGIKKASFEWIAFLDADDWWKPTFLEEMAKAINAHPDRSVFASGRTHVFKKLNERYNNRLLPKDGETKLMNYFAVIRNHLPLINSSNAVIRRSVIDKSGYFNPAQSKHEDHDLWMRICLYEKVVFVNKDLSYYRNTECDTASKKFYDPDDFGTFLKTISEIKKSLPKELKNDFNTYSNRFVLLTYIKDYSKYSKEDDKKVYLAAKEVLSGKNLFVLKFIKAMPFKNMYPILKFFKGNGK